VIYYLTDLTAAYDGMNRGTIQSLDRRLCDVAGLVCPNSRLIGEYLQKGAGCDARKILVVPNATRSRNVLEKPSDVPADLPADLADLPRPVVGVIGNLASNLDWHLIREAIEGTTDCSWAFVGPIDMKIAEPDLQSIRCELIERKGRIRFIGSRPYGELHKYARAFDVALLPYRKKESTFAGSATRYYEHLAACRPILATPAVDEILSKEPMLKLVTGGAGVAIEIERLRANGFRDSWESLRWRVSREETWEVRAQAMLRAAQAGLTVLQNKSGESAESSALQGAHGETYP
jgi:glycosyltransferase involved in cell wall biosynthesis